MFESVERAALQPLTAERYDPPTWSEHKVHRDHTIVVDKDPYTLPTRFIGKTVLVEGPRAIVRVYCDHELIKTHQRVAPGGRSLIHADYPENRAASSRRKPQRLIAQAEAIGIATGTFARALPEGPAPWAKLRQAQALLCFAAKYGPERVEAACERGGRDRRARNTKRVECSLLQDLLAPAEPTEDAPAQPSPARFARPNHAFRHEDAA